MGYIGTKPSAVPLTSADITDGIITSAKIADGTIVNADINASAAIAATKLSGSLGKVLQVLQVTKTATESFTGSGTNSPEPYNDITGLSLAITPSSASNKILVLGLVNGQGSNGSFVTAFRGSTNLAVPDSPSGRNSAFSGNFGSEAASSRSNDTNVTVSIMYLDSPATTSSTTYKLGVSIWDADTVYINRSVSDGNNGSVGRGVSNLILMEIGA
jgi:hypothetical protein